MTPPAIATISSKRLDYTELERVISKPRLDSYRRDGCEDSVALCRYLWNVALCESLYSSLQTLEVAFRNAVHVQWGLAISEQEWLTNSSPPLTVDELNAIGKAKQELRKRRGAITEPFLVAEMNFGFWTSLLDARYDKMWPKIIAGVFPNMPRTGRTRNEASRRMNPIRRLRNAALHHHSIWHWGDLKKQHDDLYELLEWMSAPTSALAREFDRFPSVYSAGHIQFCEKVGTLSN